MVGCKHQNYHISIIAGVCLVRFRINTEYISIFRHTYGKTKQLEDGSPGGLQVYMISTDLPSNGSIVIKPRDKTSYLFLTSIDIERQSALDAFNAGIKLE